MVYVETLKTVDSSGTHLMISGCCCSVIKESLYVFDG